MKLYHERCAGLDVHSNLIVACARIAVPGAEATVETRSFGGSMTALLALSDWLSALGVTHVVMESSGVYWKPVWHVLEGHFELVLANAMHVRNMPGRKSDVNDATWLAELLAHGLVRGSFVPPIAIQGLRDLTRTRKQLTREAAQHTQRIQKVLEDANLKMASVFSDIMGASGRAVLQAIANGEQDPERLADLTRQRLKAPRGEIVEALRGRITAHHRFLIKLHLQQIKATEAAVDLVESRLGEVMAPFRAAEQLLSTIPGVSETVARVIIAEIGDDMSRFPTAGHLRSWAGLSPGLNESAGKKLSTRTRRGGWLKTTLVQAAWCATRKKDCYLRSQFARIKSRRGPKKASLAVAASILTAAYHMLKTGAEYHDLGPAYLDNRDKRRVTKRLVNRLRSMGFSVELRAA
jgi:transposase